MPTKYYYDELTDLASTPSPHIWAGGAIAEMWAAKIAADCDKMIMEQIMKDDVTKDYVDELLEDVIPESKPYLSLPEDTGINDQLAIDGDIVAYRASATCEGTFYDVTFPVALKVETGRHSDWMEFRYKKEADAYAKKLEEKWKGVKVTKKKKPEPKGYALHNVDKIMESILSKYPDAHPRVFLTGNLNFRAELNPDYKAHRKDEDRPIWLNDCKQHLINKYGAEVDECMEADDLMGITATQNIGKRRTIICTIDKDLDMIQGTHYNFVKDEEYVIGHDQALINFYTQCLTGDKTDNIIGIKGIGPVKAKKIIEKGLDEIKTTSLEDQLYQTIFEAWMDYLFPKFDEIKEHEQQVLAIEQVLDNIQRVGELLWILREPNTLWTHPYPPPERYNVTLQEEETVKEEKKA